MRYQTHWKLSHYVNFVNIGDTVGYHNGNLWCHHWRQIVIITTLHVNFVGWWQLHEIMWFKSPIQSTCFKNMLTFQIFNQIPIVISQAADLFTNSLHTLNGWKCICRKQGCSWIILGMGSANRRGGVVSNAFSHWPSPFAEWPHSEWIVSGPWKTLGFIPVMRIRNSVQLIPS